MKCDNFHYVKYGSTRIVQPMTSPPTHDGHQFVRQLIVLGSLVGSHGEVGIHSIVTSEIGVSR
jgi:hypothetical protein